MVKNKHIHLLGALNKQTGTYCCPKLASKKEDYICPECSKALIVRQGEKRTHHFAHLKDSQPCNYYTNPTESQTHKDAKLAMQFAIEKGIPITITRKCSCKDCSSLVYEWKMPNLSKSCTVRLEHRFEYNGLNKIADLAVLYKQSIYTIFEIYNTHATCTEDRPEPWFELDASSILKSINDLDDLQLNIQCIRKEKCEDCLKKQYQNELHEWLKIYGRVWWKGDQSILDNLVRKLLGQTNDELEVYCGQQRPQHLRFDFDAQKHYEDNKKLIDIFNPFFKDFNVVISSHKGGLYSYIVKSRWYNSFDYYDSKSVYLEKCDHPYIIQTNYDLHGTVDIIKTLLKIIHLQIA